MEVKHPLVLGDYLSPTGEGSQIPPAKPQGETQTSTTEFLSRSRALPAFQRSFKNKLSANIVVGSAFRNPQLQSTLLSKGIHGTKFGMEAGGREDWTPGLPDETEEPQGSHAVVVAVTSAPRANAVGAHSLTSDFLVALDS